MSVNLLPARTAIPPLISRLMTVEQPALKAGLSLLTVTAAISFAASVLQKTVTNIGGKKEASFRQRLVVVEKIVLKNLVQPVITLNIKLQNAVMINIPMMIKPHVWTVRLFMLQYQDLEVYNALYLILTEQRQMSKYAETPAVRIAAVPDVPVTEFVLRPTSIQT